MNKQDEKDLRSLVKEPAVEEPQTAEQMDAEIKRLDLEIKRQEFAEMQLRKREREMSLRDLTQRVTERELKDKQRQLDRENSGKTFMQQDNEDSFRQRNCSHKKGGLTSPRNMQVLKTGGDSQFYAVIKHQMINGDIWARCQRCAKTWKPVVEEDFFFRAGKVVAPKDGVFDAKAFEAAEMEYQRALAFTTNNTMSGSVQCRFTHVNPETKRTEDAAHVYRSNVASSNLR